MLLGAFRYNDSGANFIPSSFRVIAVSAGHTGGISSWEIEQQTNSLLAGALVHAVATAHGYGGWHLLAHHLSYERPAKNLRARYVCYKLGE
jgi:hypothetical protein